MWSNLVSFTYAASPKHSFPNIPFATFSDTIQSIFGPNISLATVLAILFTLIENPDLLNLHLRQQQCKYNIENKVQISGWIIALVNALTNQLGSKRTETLFSGNELAREPDGKKKVDILAGKLDDLAITLKLVIYDGEGNYKGKLLPVSRHKIEPAYVICPPSFVCGTASCNPRSLVQYT